jgi:hypothetical protein
MHYLLLITVLFIIIATTLSFGQEKKNRIQFGGFISHHLKNEEMDFYPFDPHDGYYNFPISPGIEITYERKIFPNYFIATGINFQKVHVSSYIRPIEVEYTYVRRFRYNETSIPLLIKRAFKLKKRNSLYSTAGLYFGKQTKIVSETPVRVGWDNWYDLSIIQGYSNDTFFSDIYLDFGYHQSFSNRFNISLSPYIKYRINDTWLTKHVKRFQYGFKIYYSIKF